MYQRHAGERNDEKNPRGRYRFGATVDSGDEDENTQAGNPEIVQEQSWRYELNLELRLPQDIGVVNSQFYYRDVEDVIDRVDVSPTPEDLQSARGNIGDGDRYGARQDVHARLEEARRKCARTQPDHGPIR